MREHNCHFQRLSFSTPPVSLFTLGLVHDASVTGIDSVKGLVSVEWYENGETKGKEVRFYLLLIFLILFFQVDLAQLIQLNPQFGNFMATPTSGTKASRRTNVSAAPSSVSPSHSTTPTQLALLLLIIIGYTTFPGVSAFT